MRAITTFIVRLVPKRKEGNAESRTINYRDTGTPVADNTFRARARAPITARLESPPIKGERRRRAAPVRRKIAPVPSIERDLSASRGPRTREGTLNAR